MHIAQVQEGDEFRDETGQLIWTARGPAEPTDDVQYEVRLPIRWRDGAGDIRFFECETELAIHRNGELS